MAAALDFGTRRPRPRAGGVRRSCCGGSGADCPTRIGPGFDLGLALLGYKLFYRRTHRDYVQVLAFSFVLVLVAATLTATFLFMVAFLPSTSGSRSGR